MKTKYLIITIILALCIGLLIPRFSGCCFKKHDPIEIEPIDNSQLWEQIRYDSIIIATLSHAYDSLEQVKQKKITIVRNEVKRIKSTSEIIEYIGKELGDTGLVKAVLIGNDSFIVFSIKCAQKIYNAFYERISYKELYFITEEQLKLQDSSLIICLNDVDSLVTKFRTVEQQNKLLGQQNKDLNLDITKLNKKVKNRNKAIWILSGTTAIEAGIIYVLIRFF